MLAISTLLMLFFTGCATPPAALPTHGAIDPVRTATLSDYLIQPGDQLNVKFYYNPELNDSLIVRPDGKISLQLIDDIRAAGLTPAQLDQAITEKYSLELRQPLITIVVQSFSSQQVYVGGEVNTQGPINLISGMTPLHAVLNAGGFKETAKPEDIIVVRKGADNRPIPIPINLKEALYGKSEAASLQLQPYDIVYVPKTSIAKVNTFVDQYIRQLLLFQGWGFGAFYDLNPEN
jgi:protein involved in polysaccharide export with SLBB domain